MTEYIGNADELFYPYYDVAIRDKATGEVRIYRDTYGWGEGTKFLWMEGNFACDCNRKKFFEAASGEEPSTFGDCGETAYTAIEAIFPDGKRLKLEGGN